MNEQETKWRPKFIRWIKEERVFPTCIYELKHTRGKKDFALAELKEHQVVRLNNATSDIGFQYTIPNSSLGNKALDGIYFRNGPAFVAIHFVDRAYVIPWNLLRRFYEDEYPAKILTPAEAISIAAFIIVDKKYLQH